MFNHATAGTVPRFIVGETLYSWVVRATSTGQLVGLGLFDMPGNPDLLAESKSPLCVDELQCLLCPDIEFDPNSWLYYAVARASKCSVGFLARYYAQHERWLTNPHYRYLYCPDCFKDSMALYGFPMWRQSWCIATSSYCILHKRLLQKPLTICATDERIWHCYIDSLSSSTQPCSVQSKIEASLTIRVQRWMRNRDAQQTPLAKALRLLYSILLLHPTKFSTEGIASAAFGPFRKTALQKNLSIHARAALGVDTSDARQRSGALIIIGWLMGVLSEDEVAYLKRVDPRVRQAVPSTAQALGTLISRGFSHGEFQYASEHLFALKHNPSNHVELFLAALYNGAGCARNSRSS